MQPKDLSEIGKINLRYYKVPEHEVSSLQFKELSATGEEIEKTFKLDLLSKVIWLLRTSRPSWSGFMQLYHKHGDYPGKSTIGFMPMIDMNPSDLSCINSTLHFVSSLSSTMSPQLSHSTSHCFGKLQPLSTAHQVQVPYGK